MTTTRHSDSRRRALRNYLAGLGAVVVAAGLTHAFGSMWPLALAGAASLMLTVPLVRSFMLPGRARR